MRLGISIPLSFVAISGLLTACSDNGPDLMPVGAYDPKWTELADGSQFARVPNNRPDPNDPAAAAAAPAIAAAEDQNRTSVGIRCWEEGSGKEQLCLRAERSSGISPMLSIHISHEPEMPSIVLPYGNTEGYSCLALMGSITEEIRRSDTVLISNRIDYSTSPWSRSYVQRFMRDNNVSGEWFDCDRLIRIIHSGSLETLSTTAVSRSMLPN